MLNPGTLLQGRYQILRWLGGGGMGAVYQAADLRLAGKQVAVKQMLANPGASQAEQKQAEGQFQAEATLLATLDHANLPRVYDYFAEGGQNFLVMEYVDGETLEAIQARTSGFLPETRVQDWAVQICDALTYLHGRQPPIIFRDLKPANIMVNQQGVVKLIDFGIARIFKPGQRTDTLRMGTMGYAPPEQYAGHGQTDARSDIYSLGATLHHLLTGRDPAQHPPFSFDTAPPRRLNPSLSAATEAVVMKALAYSAADRFQSASEMRRALLAAGLSLTAPVTPASRRSRFPAFGGAVVLLVAVAAAALAFLARSGLMRPTEPATAAEPPSPAATAALITETPPPPTAPASPGMTPSEPAPTTPPEATPVPESIPTSTTQPEATQGDGLGKIAFYSTRDGNDEIYVMDGDGGYQRRLTYHAASDVYPALSPDGQRIAFVSERDGQPEIYMINIDGSAETRLTYDPGEDRLPTWSPDGTMIAFNSDRAGSLDLYAMDANGNALTQLTHNPARDGHATWAPDGRWLAFNSGMTQADWELYIMPATGGDWRQLTVNATMDWSPNWSPVDGRIVYLAWRGNKTTIAIVNADGGGQWDVFSDLSGIWAPNWSPDGRRIAFTAKESGRDEIYVLSLDDNRVTQLTYDGAAYPSWSW